MMNAPSAALCNVTSDALCVANQTKRRLSFISPIFRCHISAAPFRGINSGMNLVDFNAAKRHKMPTVTFAFLGQLSYVHRGLTKKGQIE
ncbi:hypothetical protein L596_002715 [Steinernema carpocapsae]|uniref:Uncharacterized protein n=1 Tax=Steinernema carpocapsae TaxID=34508 RepID=A0A4U8URW9_STECR|nr:hypothetical protein L596_002715 [Steinernema carpocapsae]